MKRLKPLIAWTKGLPWSAALTGALGAAAVLLLWAMIRWAGTSKWISDHGALAGWVQAVGSVAALAWGVDLYRRQNTDKRADAESRRFVAVIGVIDMIGFATDQIEGVYIQAQGNISRLRGFYQVSFDRLNGADEVLARVPFFEAADGTIFHAVLTMRSRLGQIRRRCEEYNRALKGAHGLSRDEKLAECRRQIGLVYKRADEDHLDLCRRYPGAHPRVGPSEKPRVGLS